MCICWHKPWFYLQFSCVLSVSLSYCCWVCWSIEGLIHVEMLEWSLHFSKLCIVYIVELIKYTWYWQKVMSRQVIRTAAGEASCRCAVHLTCVSQQETSAICCVITTADWGQKHIHTSLLRWSLHHQTCLFTLEALSEFFCGGRCYENEKLTLNVSHVCRQERRDLGLTVLVDCRKQPAPSVLYSGLSQFQVRYHTEPGANRPTSSQPWPR